MNVSQMIIAGSLEMRKMQKAAVSIGEFALQSIESGLKELQPTVHLLYMTGDRIFRNPMASGTATTWKVMTSVNSGAPTLGYCADGKRSSQIEPVTADRTQSFSTLGLEVAITHDAKDEADTSVFLGAGYDADGLLNAHLLEQYLLINERTCMWSNKETALGAAAIASGVATAGGELAVGVYWARVVPLTKDGFDLGEVSATGLLETVEVETPDGQTYDLQGGTGLPADAMAAGITAALNDKITWAVTDHKSAVAYAWFVGVNATAPADSAMYLQAITNVNTYTQEAQVTTTQTLDGNFAADHSQEPLSTDGIYYQNFVVGTGNGYYKTMNGLPLNIDPVGRVVEFDEALMTMWDTYKISPDEIILAVDIHSALLSSVFVQDKSKFRLQFNQGDMEKGLVLGSYLFGYRHPRTGEIIPIIADPNSPLGIVHMPKWRHSMPNNPINYTTDYLSFGGATKIDWTGAPTRENQYGIYSRGTYRSYIPNAFAMIRNIVGVTEV